MRAAFYDETGPASDVLQLGDLPAPQPEAGEVLVRVHASGVNPADVKRRAGWGGMAMAHPRVIPHCDGAGIVEGIGAGVPQTRIGERVWLWNAQGGYGSAGRAFGTAAEYVALPSAQAVVLPDRYDMATGTCLGVPAMTAHRCVMADGPVSGQSVLIQGGGGAVGFLAAQIAIAEGAQVIATVSNERAAGKLQEIGVTPINRHTEDLVARVAALSKGSGVERIVEVDFAANQHTDTSLIRPNGTVASYSSSSNVHPTLDYYAFAAKGANVRFVQGFGLSAQARAEAQTWIAANPLSIPVAETYTLDDIAKAHAAVETGGLFGQVVVQIVA